MNPFASWFLPLPLKCCHSCQHRQVMGLCCRSWDGLQPAITGFPPKLMINFTDAFKSPLENWKQVFSPIGEEGTGNAWQSARGCIDLSKQYFCRCSNMRAGSPKYLGMLMVCLPYCSYLPSVQIWDGCCASLWGLWHLVTCLCCGFFPLNRACSLGPSKSHPQLGYTHIPLFNFYLEVNNN